MYDGQIYTAGLASLLTQLSFCAAMYSYVGLGIVVGLIGQQLMKLLYEKLRSLRRASDRPSILEYDPLTLTEIWLIRHGETDSNAGRVY